MKHSKEESPDTYPRRAPIFQDGLNSLEPFFHLIQALHGDGGYHGHFALVVLEHQHQIKVLQVKLQTRGTHTMTYSYNLSIPAN